LEFLKQNLLKIIGAVIIAIAVPTVLFAISAPEKVKDLESAVLKLTGISEEQEKRDYDHEKQLAIHEQKFETFQHVQMTQSSILEKVVEKLDK